VVVDVTEILQVTAIQSRNRTEATEESAMEDKRSFPGVLFVACLELPLLLLRSEHRTPRLMEFLELIDVIVQDTEVQERLLDAGLFRNLLAAISANSDEMPMALFSKLLRTVRRFGSLRLRPADFQQLLHVIQSTYNSEGSQQRRTMLLECASDIAEGASLRGDLGYETDWNVDAENPDSYVLAGNPFGAAQCLQFKVRV
jgi:hypothetical protein